MIFLSMALMGFEHGSSYMKLKTNRHVYSFAPPIKLSRLLFYIINITFGYYMYALYTSVKLWTMFSTDIVI